MRELEDVGPGHRALLVRRPGPSAPMRSPVGVDFDLSFERLSAAAAAVREGAFFAVTNRDPIFPMPDGLKAGAGAMVAAHRHRLRPRAGHRHRQARAGPHA